MTGPMDKMFAKSKDYVPIEINERYLTMAHIKVTGLKQEIVNVATAEIFNLPHEEVSKKIREFISGEGVKKPEIINVIPSNLAIFKNIEIPSVDKKEIKDIIELQAGRHTPYSRGEIILDYMEIGVVHNRYTKILLVIVKKEAVVSRYDIIKMAGFKAESAILSSESISKLYFNLFPEKSLKAPVAIVHIDSVSSDFSVIFGDKIIYLRSIPIGVFYINSNPVESKQTFLDEIKKSMDSYMSENIEAAPSKIYFAGITDMITDVVGEEVKANMHVDVEIMSCGRVFTMPKSVEDKVAQTKSVSLLPMLAATFISGQPSLNLIPEEVKIGKELQKKARRMMEAGIFLMAVLVMFCAILLTDLFFKKAYLSKLVSSYSEENKSSIELQNISDRTAIVKRFLSQKGASLSVLTELFKIMPKEIYLNSIDLKSGDTITTTGTADTMSRVFALVTDLENTKTFKNVKVDFTKTRRVKEQEVADFGLTFNIEGVQLHE